MSVIIRLQRLSWDATAADIRDFFRGMQIPEGGVHIVGGNEGDAFIAFASDEDARQAMRLDGKRIKDQRIKLLLSSRVEMQKVIEQARGDFAAATGGAQPNDVLADSPTPAQFNSPPKDMPWNTHNTPSNADRTSVQKLGSHYGGDEAAIAGAVSGFSSFPSKGRAPDINQTQAFGGFQLNKQAMDPFTAANSRFDTHSSSRLAKPQDDSMDISPPSQTMSHAHPPEPNSLDYMLQSNEPAFSKAGMFGDHAVDNSQQQTQGQYIGRWMDGKPPNAHGFESGAPVVPMGRMYGREVNTTLNKEVWSDEGPAPFGQQANRQNVPFNRSGGNDDTMGYNRREPRMREGRTGGFPDGANDFDPYQGPQSDRGPPFARGNMGISRDGHQAHGRSFDQVNKNDFAEKTQFNQSMQPNKSNMPQTGRNSLFGTPSGDEGMGVGTPDQSAMRMIPPMGRQGGHPTLPFGRNFNEMQQGGLSAGDKSPGQRFPTQNVNDPAPRATQAQMAPHQGFGAGSGPGRMSDNWRGGADPNQRGRFSRPVLLSAPEDVGSLATNVPPPNFPASKDLSPNFPGKGAQPNPFAKDVILPILPPPPFGKDAPPFGKDVPPFGKDTQPFGKDAQPFGKDAQPFGKDAQPFGKDAPPFGKDASRFSKDLAKIQQSIKDAQQFGKDVPAFGKDTHHAPPNFPSFEKDDAAKFGQDRGFPPKFPDGDSRHHMDKGGMNKTRPPFGPPPPAPPGFPDFRGMVQGRQPPPPMSAMMGFPDPAPGGPFGDLPSRGMPPDPMHRDARDTQQNMQQGSKNNTGGERYIMIDRLPTEMKQYRLLKDFLRAGGVMLDRDEPMKISRDNKAGQHILTAYVRLASPQMMQLALNLNGRNGIRVVASTEEDFDYAALGFANTSHNRNAPPPSGQPQPLCPELGSSNAPNPWLAGAPPVPVPGRGGLLSMPVPIKPSPTKSQEAHSHPQQQQQDEYIIELNNMPYRARPDDALHLFGQHRPTRVLRATRDFADCDTWFAFFTWPPAYEAALSQRGAQLNGRNIRVSGIDKEMMERKIDEIVRKGSRVRDREKRTSPARDRTRHRDSNDRERRRSRSRSREHERSNRSASSSKDSGSYKDKDREREKGKERKPKEEDVVVKIDEAHDAVHITGLPMTMTERDVNAYLLRLQGHPTSIRLMKEPAGSAYALFSRISDCAKVVAAKPQFIGPNKITIRSCHRSEMHEDIKKQFAPLQKAAQNGDQTRQPSNGQASIKPASDPEVEDPKPKVSPSRQPSPAMKGPPIDPSVIRSIGATGCVLVLHNLPPTVSLDELATFFAGFNLLEDSVRMHYNDAGTATGDALLAVGTAQDAHNAVQALDNTKLHGFTVRMYIADSN